MSQPDMSPTKAQMRRGNIQFQPYEGPKPVHGLCPDPSSPADALKDPVLAHLFHHYITNLAPWYDLSDAEQNFTRLIPRKALTTPLLFSAVIAFASIYSTCTAVGSMRTTAEFYHSSCVEHLLSLDDTAVQSEGDVTLAAVCLLRSYEILAEDFDPNRHLSGAHAIASGQSLDLRSASLHRAAFFNFLREDITFALMNKCPLKIDPEKLKGEYTSVSDEDQLNIVTLILGQSINACFGDDSPVVRKGVLHQLDRWKRVLPSHFQPIHDWFSDSKLVSMFPRIYMLHDSHVAAIQYGIVTESVLASATTVQNEAMLFWSTPSAPSASAVDISEAGHFRTSFCDGWQAQESRQAGLCTA
ncbi:hypothetical protein M409DRAFT_15683 [Zasmidium cellare ATCC 36951]|uniref:Transcription factor domain-containing protein n=1 Tax=Zasmidium cellare ATCC 36951 TaxID=1080233 RepID=A0A6A6D5I8_ZASCE|nr:uncharacterized protein M409DRAFT_15683 [Zasmidium cellare ATCC 36951]KAF2173399.1 hypothetical protein M409DRAFT_15683 [Zasmidium cellare ATCC 36951]